MHTEVKEVGPFERMLTLHLDGQEMDGAKERAARKLSSDMKIKGFRQGKAPRAIVERMVGAGALRTEAVEEALPRLLGKVLEEADLNPVTTPRLEDIRDSDEGGVDVDVRITLWPELTSVPDFEDRRITVDVPAVSEDDVDEQIERVRSQFAELEDVDRPAIAGDYVMVNITTLLNGEQLEDASASDLLYEVGSRSFIRGLDEVLMGVEKGGIAEGAGTLPDGFGDHGGEEVTLRVLVKGVRAKKLPEVTDEWVSDVSEFETIEDLRKQLRENLEQGRVGALRSSFHDALVIELLDEMDLVLPEPLVEAEMEASIRNLINGLQERGIDLDNYLSITGQTEQQLIDEARARAERALKTRILFEGVAASEGIEVEDGEIEEAIVAIAGTDNDPEEVRKALAASGQEQLLVGDILRRKALEKMVAAATAIDTEGNPIDLSPPEPVPSESGGHEDDREHESDEATADDGGDEPGTLADAADES